MSSQLKMVQLASYLPLPDANLAADTPVTQGTMLTLSHNAKFAAVRLEAIPCGFFANGNIVPAPVSPVDGYAYTREECIFKWEMYSNRRPALGFTPGQLTRPADAASEPANLYHFEWDIDDST